MNNTPHHLAALADAAVPGLRPVDLHMVAENIGERFHVGFVVDDEERAWVVRLPADRVSAALQEASIPFLLEVGRHLPFDVPQPAGTAALGDGRPAMVYPYLYGRIVDFALLPPGPGIATGIGAALAALHDVPVGALDDTGVPVYDAQECRHRLVSDVDRGARTGLVPTQLLTRWERTLDDASWWDFTTVPVHGYLSNAHLLTDFPTEDTSSGRVSAIVSWEGAKIGDPAEDLAAIARSAPPEAVDTVFGAYAQHRRGTVDPHLRERARLLGELRLLSRLLAAHSSGDEPAVAHVVRTMRRLVDLLADDTLAPSTSTVRTAVPVTFEDEPVDEDWYSSGATLPGGNPRIDVTGAGSDAEDGGRSSTGETTYAGAVPEETPHGSGGDGDLRGPDTYRG
ncbi:phosphotransferase [Mobilicoccus pelagius]|uniref:phosphotransferase n=1 Tax=Mobilicoccus pelagius TaxID=746032 RepID=UPI0002DFBFF0|nr:phosphotransferase [Mobilicoccus pelagius]